ncbi:MAG: TrkH family potassium uptake protein [Acidimicrobiia bacterium]|nr:TrkH family potassium uptake protein [Acidimicrobiia bacterium]
MLLRPSAHDLKFIAHDLGRILAVVALAGLLPLGWALARREWAPASHVLVMIGFCILAAGAAQLIDPGRRTKVDWSHGLVVVALTWLVVPAVATIPLFLSGHYGSWIDSYFDAMSGVTTTGLAVIQDLDHLSDAANMWRHTIQFLGGQGIVLAALTFFSASGALSLYQAEGRDDRIFPSVGSTARFIWLVSIVHLIFGVTALTIDGVIGQGFTFDRSLFHALAVFMAAFDTGGFSPQSTSIAYYHSALYEVIIAVLMVAGAMSFGLHHAIWTKRRGLVRNLEVRTLAITMGITIVVTLIGLTAIYADPSGLVRRGLFQVVSAHTGTGFATVSSAELSRWSGLAFAGMAVAMALGGMSSSTAGGVKSLRIGLTVRALIDTVKAALLPEHTVMPANYTQYGRQRLDARLAQSVMTVSLLYVGLYLFGAAVGIANGYGLQESLFESVSAAAAVGLSVGVTSPAMPLIMKLTMIFQMWIGRLEFIAAFALAGFVWSTVAGE